jgi:hypothetical protein
MVGQIATLLIYVSIGFSIGALYYVLILDNDQKFLFLFAMYLFSSIVTSCIYISINPTFITETGTTSQPTYAWLFYLIMNLIIVVGAGVISSVIRRSRQHTRPWMEFDLFQEKIALAILGVVLSVELFNIMISHPNGFDGESFNRSRFFEDIARLAFLPNLFGVLAFFVPVVGGAIFFGSSNKMHRIIAGIYLLMYFAYLRGIGQVFHGMLFPASMVGAIYLVLRHHGRTKFSIPIKSTAIAFVLVAGVIVYNSFMNRGISNYLGGPLEGIIYRVLVLQGSASDAIFNLWQGGRSMTFDDTLEGRDYWINNTMPQTLANNFMDAGVNLQGAVPGTFLLFGGLFGGAILCFVYGMFIALANNAIVAALRKGAIFALFPASYLWVWVFGLYARASFEEVIKPKVIVMLILYWALMKIVPKRNRAEGQRFAGSMALRPGRRSFSRMR